MNERLNQTLTAPPRKTAIAFARRYDASPPPSALAAAAALSATISSARRHVVYAHFTSAADISLSASASFT